MNKDDVIRMAREASLNFAMRSYEQDLQKFAALVAAAEREACAKVCEEVGDGGWNNDGGCDGVDPVAETCAAAIRARGEQE